MVVLPGQESWDIWVAYAAQETHRLKSGVSFQSSLVMVAESCLEGSLVAITEDITLFQILFFSVWRSSHLFCL